MSLSKAGKYGAGIRQPSLGLQVAKKNKSNTLPIHGIHQNLSMTGNQTITKQALQHLGFVITLNSGPKWQPKHLNSDLG